VRRRSLHTSLGALVLVLALSACGGSSASPTASTASSPATSTASAAPAAAGRSRRSFRPRRASHHARLARSSAKPKPKPRGPTVLTYGTEASPTQRSRAARALRGYLEARAKGEWSAACSYLAVAARRQAEALTATSARGGGCAAAYAALYGAASASQRANPFTGLTALRVKGRHGSAVFLSSSGAGYVMPMLSEGGSWRPTQLSPYPYPPASQG
jgi:hypothetical protein